MAPRPQATQLTPLDRAFLYLERRSQPFHVAYLNVFTPPRGASPLFARELAEQLRACAKPVAPFDRRLQHRYGGAWVADARFDIDQHFVRLAVPQPGWTRDLMQLVSQLHATPLDRTRPLWQVYLIEGLNDGRIATYCKMHHALVDGIAGTRQLLKSMSPEQDQRLPPPWAAASTVQHENGARTQRMAPFLEGLRGGLAALPAVLGELRQTLFEERAGRSGSLIGGPAPACILNQPISSSREFVARSYSLPRIKALCGAFNCTTNDIVLALCASALRRYLQDQNALPDRPLIAMVPMSTRHDGSDSGNQLVPLLVDLATDLANPLERLRTIRESTDRSKDHFSRLGAAEAYGYALVTSARGLLNLLLKPSRGNLAFNVVISKVPGPKSQMYWQGCRLDGMYPVSVVMDGLALNITVASRHEWLDFGLVACPQTLPRVRRLLVYLEDAVNELESRTRPPLAPKPEISDSLLLSPSRKGISRSKGLNARRVAAPRIAEPLPLVAG